MFGLFLISTILFFPQLRESNLFSEILPDEFEFSGVLNPRLPHSIFSGDVDASWIDMTVQDTLSSYLENEFQNSIVPDKTRKGANPIGQVVLGSLFALGGGYGGVLIGYSIGSMGSSGDSYGWFGPGFGEAVIGLAIGTPLGSFIGISCLGKKSDHASLGATLLGCCLGSMVGIESQSTALFFILPSIGGTLAYHLSAKPDQDKETGAALLNVDHNAVSVNPFPVSLQPHPCRRREWMANITILHVVF